MVEIDNLKKVFQLYSTYYLMYRLPSCNRGTCSVHTDGVQSINSQQKGQVKRAPAKGMKGNMLQPGPGPQQTSPRVVPPRAHPPGGEIRSSSGGQGSRPKVVLEVPGQKTII